MLAQGLDVQKIIKVVDKAKIELNEPTTITENQLGKEEKEIERSKIYNITSVKID